MTENEFLERYDAGAKFSEEELRGFVWEEFECIKQVETIEGDYHRWQREMSTIIKVEDWYFRIDWMAALTECQESDFPCQPIEVKYHEWQETVTKHEWLPVEEQC